MKLLSITLYALFIVSCAACTETSEVSTNETKNNGEDTVQITPDTALIDTKHNVYEQEWNSFKEAILSKDVQKVAAFFQSDNLDAEQVIFAFHEDFVFPVFQKTTFSDLKEEEMDGVVYTKFYAEITGLDEDGYEIGSSYTFYFEKTNSKLQLVYYIAAG